MKTHILLQHWKPHQDSCTWQLLRYKQIEANNSTIKKDIFCRTNLNKLQHVHIFVSRFWSDGSLPPSSGQGDSCIHSFQYCLITLDTDTHVSYHTSFWGRQTFVKYCHYNIHYSNKQIVQLDYILLEGCATEPTFVVNDGNPALLLAISRAKAY